MLASPLLAASGVVSLFSKGIVVPRVVRGGKGGGLQVDRKVTTSTTGFNESHLLCLVYFSP